MARWIKAASVWLSQDGITRHGYARPAVLNQLDKSIESLKGLELDLVVFSEQLSSQGQTMDEAESLAEPGALLQRFEQCAKQHQCTVAGNLKLVREGKVYNCITYHGPDGLCLGVYAKTFLTQYELDRGIAPGQGAVVVDTPAGRLGGAVCFDLNFEELCQQYVPLKPDIMVFPSMYHGGLMQSAWAYRCRSYFISALQFLGGGIIDPYGRPLASTDCYSQVAISTLNLDRVMVHLDWHQEKFVEINRKYVGKVKIDIPPNVGSALITSLDPDLTAMDIVREYELIQLDEYLAMSRQANKAAKLVASSPSS